MDTTNDAAATPHGTYYASGSNSAASIRGFARIEHAIGVAAPELTAEAIDELEATGGARPVFVDSGAFSEVDFTPAPVVVRPITFAMFSAILALYLRLAKALGAALSVVAPDRVGDQQLTLERLAEHREALAEIAATGARVLVPVQKGAMSQADFWRAARELLGFECTPALPCKKNATTMDELDTFAADLGAELTDVHLLGLGATNTAARKAMASFAEHCPGARVTLDSCLVRSKVGLTNGPGGGPRILTACRAIAAEAIRSGVVAGELNAKGGGPDVQELGIVLAFGKIPAGVDRVEFVRGRLAAASARAAA